MWFEGGDRWRIDLCLSRARRSRKTRQSEPGNMKGTKGMKSIKLGFLRKWSL
jgi:hypothetical protein